jgi:hypothetical protein
VGAKGGNVELLDAKDSDTGYRLNRRAAPGAA